MPVYAACILLSVTVHRSFDGLAFNKIIFVSLAFAAANHVKIINSTQKDGKAVEGLLYNKPSTTDAAHPRNTVYELEDMMGEILL